MHIRILALAKKLVGNKLLFIAITSVPIIVFLLPMLMSGTNTLFPGDFDMQIQMTEAAKISVLQYGQFPFWNPWISGGVPLFADPQFGLVTPQTLLSFFMDSAYAWKLTILLYFLAGFYSMYLLLRYINKELGILVCLLLSYTWILGSFFSLRAIGGHFTFLVLALLPLAILLFLRISEKKIHFLLLSLLLAYCLNAAVHYSTILIILTLFVIAGISIVYSFIADRITKKQVFTQTKRAFKNFGLLLLALVSAFALTSFRLYQTFEYLKDNSVVRTDIGEKFIGILDGAKALFLPYGTYTMPNASYNPFEASNFIGTITGLLLFGCATFFLYKFLHKSSKPRKTPPGPIVVIFSTVTLVAFVIGLGGPFFTLARHLPVISSMRVSTRFFFIAAVGIIVILSLLLTKLIAKQALGRHTYGILLVVLVFSITQVYYEGFKLQYATWVNNTYLVTVNHDSATQTQSIPPRTEKRWTEPLSHERAHYHALTSGTLNHRSQAIADNALVDTRALPTERCDEDEQACLYVLTANATVVQWSPNQFTVKRTQPGPIKLNINQAAHWKVNGYYPFKHQKITKSNSTFTLDDLSTDTFLIQYTPIPRLFK